MGGATDGGDAWRAAGRGRDSWPEGVRIWEDRMYLNGRLCVPTELTGRLIRAHHAVVGHVVGDKLVTELAR